MSEFKVASRYAKSLIDLTTEQSDLDKIKGEVEQFIEVLRANTELQAVLRNPIIKQDKKLNILKGVFESKIDPLLITFFSLMVRKGRGGILPATANEFIRQYNEVKGIVHATVTSATKLSEANKAALIAQLEKEINADIVLKNTVDPSLIGGFVVNVGDRQIDTSISGKLNKLGRHFQSQTR